MSYWKQFQFESNSKRYGFDGNGKPTPIFYRHWLPMQLNSFQCLKKYSPLSCHDGNRIPYEEFDTLLHVTSFENACKIFEDGGFEQQFVKDSSVVNPDIVLLKWYKGYRVKVDKKPHPFSNRKVLWYGPYSRSKATEPFEEVERYGNVAFNMALLDGQGGLVVTSGMTDEFRYYFIEVIDYQWQSACRILVTKFDHPELRVYDPEIVGGPWYYNRTENKHYHLVKIPNSDRKIVRNTVEFMREETSSFEAYSTWVMNHQISYKSCSQPRAGVSVDDPGWNSRFKLVFGTLAFRFKNSSMCFPPPRSLLFNGFAEVKEFIDLFRILHNYANTTTMNVSDSSITFNPNDHSASDLSTSDNESEDRVQSVASKMKLTKNFFSKMESSNYRQTGSELLHHYSSIKNELDSRLLDIEYLVSVVLIFYRSEFFNVSQTFCDIYREMLIFFHPKQIAEVMKFFEEKIHCELIGSGVRSGNGETSVHECLD
ncbi:Hypothetical predicted protein [Mytilus galloprovincialis]|uniref:Uncharacterized protein n=1 Tax=Mytilus galloprovincialis TaxID=29158 RepID=A0A8B6H2X5_MYTGA|nr:Hypothetical predicted protein [Mytilus galloprovincialis]